MKSLVKVTEKLLRKKEIKISKIIFIKYYLKMQRKLARQYAYVYKKKTNWKLNVKNAEYKLVSTLRYLRPALLVSI